MNNRRRGPRVNCDEGVYVQIYPSTLVNASRMVKIGTSVQTHLHFAETHLVGVQAGMLPEQEQLAAGVVLRRIRGSGRRGNLGRLLRVALWQPRVLLEYWRRPLAAVAVHNVWLLPLGRMLSRATGAVLVYNAHELETETFTMRGVKRWAAKAIESRLITSCDLVSVVNESIADWYQARYEIERPVVVGNVPVVKNADVGLRERLGVRSDEMLYVHTGHLVEGRNIPLILETFSTSHHHVVFLGDGHLRPSVVAAADKHPNIHWLQPVDPDLIVAHVREADVGLCLIEHQLDLSDKLSSPNKLLEALAADVPALCTDLVEARRLLGPLADQWVLDTPERGVAEAIAQIDKADVAAFKAAWPGTASWDQAARPLVAAYRRCLDAAGATHPAQPHH